MAQATWQGPPNKPARWLLPKKEMHRWCWVTWLQRQWWIQLACDVEHRVYTPLIWLGVVDLAEGGWYRDSRWRWDFWRSPRSAWNRRATVLQQLLNNEREHAVAEYERGLRDGARGLLVELAADRAREKAGQPQPRSTP